jgi:hypothetical protein
LPPSGRNTTGKFWYLLFFVDIPPPPPLHQQPSLFSSSFVLVLFILFSLENVILIKKWQFILLFASLILFVG